ncbi:unnamed protein product [Cylindrotheca closterium]|uniref:Uncharacterized protein n=1 Tax=Cylindrotheca closterium TaxID=2856 RepID=A0AAD2FRM7_9STRA|nr:unnamed protein product [Cylindrotheca closterium]
MSDRSDDESDGKPAAKRLRVDSDSPASSAADAAVDLTHDDESAGSDSSAPGSKDPKIWGNIEFMKVIKKSPYEPPNASAEVSEKAFDEVKKLLLQPDDGSAVVPQAARLFGSRLAESLVTAFFQIGRSGMLFSPQWQEGKIRGVTTGWIPKALLLLCLHEQRFVRANEATLAGIIKDLGLCQIVGDSINEWRLDRKFINLSSNTAYTFTKNKAVCYKCEIFVARAFRCVKVLKWTRFEPTLWKKVMDCLTIMNEHVRVSKNGVAKRISELDEDEVPVVVEKRPAKKAAAKKQKETEATDIANRMRLREERHESMDTLIGMYEEHANRMQHILVVFKRKMREEKEDRDSMMSDMRAQIREEERQKLLQEQNGVKRK